MTAGDNFPLDVLPRKAHRSYRRYPRALEAKRSRFAPLIFELDDLPLIQQLAGINGFLGYTGRFVDRSTISIRERAGCEYNNKKGKSHSHLANE